VGELKQIIRRRMRWHAKQDFLVGYGENQSLGHDAKALAEHRGVTETDYVVVWCLLPAENS
jgi:hypothetical protein